MIGKVLQLSTANHPEDPQVSLYVRSSPTEYGMIIWPTSYVDGLPDWLLPIVELANRERCAIIEFDCDNEPHPGLPTYKW